MTDGMSAAKRDADEANAFSLVVNAFRAAIIADYAPETLERLTLAINFYAEESGFAPLKLAGMQRRWTKRIEDLRRGNTATWVWLLLTFNADTYPLGEMYPPKELESFVVEAQRLGCTDAEKTFAQIRARSPWPTGKLYDVCGFKGKSRFDVFFFDRVSAQTKDDLGNRGWRIGEDGIPDHYLLVEHEDGLQEVFWDGLWCEYDRAIQFRDRFGTGIFDGPEVSRIVRMRR